MGYSSNLLPDVPAFLPPVGSSQSHGQGDGMESHLGLSPEQQQKLQVCMFAVIQAASSLLPG